MTKNILEIVSGIVSIYFVALTVFCGLLCILFVSPYIKSGGYKKEAIIAKIGGWVYIGGSVVLYLGLKIFM